MSIEPQFIHLTTILVISLISLVEAINRRPPRR